MVVGKDHARAAVDRGVGDNLPKRQIGPAKIAVMARQMNAARLVIDMGDPQMFPGRIGLGEAVGEEAPGRVQTI